MATATAYPYDGAHWYVKADAYIESTTDTEATIVCNSYWCSNAYGFSVENCVASTTIYLSSGNAYSGEQTFTASSGYAQSVELLVATVKKTVKRTNIDQKISCGATALLAGGFEDGQASPLVIVTVPKRTYQAPGTPTLSASKTTVNYGDSITLTWSKASNQGNASFTRFELWNGTSKKLYSGSATSQSVKPSDISGAKGGNVKYVIREYHDWYGEDKYTEASVTVAVRSGVVTVYDKDGKKHIGLVTAYDKDGKKHYVLISAYDKDGKKHNVV